MYANLFYMIFVEILFKLKSNRAILILINIFIFTKCK